MTPADIVILTNERDFAADDVIRHLQLADVNVVRLNIEAARCRVAPSWSPTDDAALPPVLVWWRQFEAYEQPKTLSEVDDVLVERSQWRSWISVLDRPGAVWINNLWAARRAENKIEQLRVASRLGFTVPPTIVTNDVATAREFATDVGESIVKTIASAFFAFSDQSFVFTEPLEHPSLSGYDRPFSTPLIVQKRLVHALDARVVSFGSHTFGAHCRAKDIDWRKTPYEPALWEEWSVPEAIARLCNDYRAQFGLEYAAFDFMIDGDSIYFLEANQAGEWTFLDRALDLGISRSLASRLQSLATASGN